MRNQEFLKSAENSNALISESKILIEFSKLKKSVIISTQNLINIQRYFYELKTRLERSNKSEFLWIQIRDSGSIKETCLSTRADLNDGEIMNLVQEKLRDYNGNSFVIYNSIKFVFTDGNINSEAELCLSNIKNLETELGKLKQVCDLDEVFEHFLVKCKYDKSYYDKCFLYNRIIKKDIKEQELRNILRGYLDENVRGEVSTEYCTDFVNDEESVDIYINDGIQRAIIEVKFSFDKKYYEGKTYYDIYKRTRDGINQLDKYAYHLQKDDRSVDFSYAYMFYINDKEVSEIENNMITINNEIKEKSTALQSSFKGIKLNDMKKWNSENRI